jgi:thioredoxin-related protein
MKTKILLFLLVVIPFSSKPQEKKGIDFQEGLNWSAVLEKANKERKYIFLDVFTTWCGPCKMMDRDVYPNEKLGILVNKDFISVRVQMDITPNDNANVKSWYNDAKNIANSAKVEAYPCFLFYSSDGELVYKSIGYKDVISFTNLVRFACNPERKDFRNQLLAYQNGDKNYPNMIGLITMTKDMLGDSKLALTMAKDYKENYLDNLPDEQLLNSENIDFINRNGAYSLVNTKDRFFFNCYYKPELVDSLSYKGLAKLYVEGVISKEYVTPQLFNNGKPILLNPNWSTIRNYIKNKYLRLELDDFMLNEMLKFYKKINNWDLYTFYRSKQIAQNPPNAEGMNIQFALNVPAWDVFLYAVDKKALQRALNWSEMSLKLDTGRDRVQFLDTKANLLYKMGRVKEALECERLAISTEDSISISDGRQRGSGMVPEFLETLRKMENAEATWQIKN